MSNLQNERDYEAFLSGESRLNEDYARLSREENEAPPNEIDESILKAANLDIVEDKSEKELKNQWQYPLALAASVVLTVSFVLQQNDFTQSPYVIENDMEHAVIPSVKEKADVEPVAESGEIVIAEDVALLRNLSVEESSPASQNFYDDEVISSTKNELAEVVGKNIPMESMHIEQLPQSSLPTPAYNTTKESDKAERLVDIADLSVEEPPDAGSAQLDKVEAEINELRQTQKLFESEVSVLKKELTKNRIAKKSLHAESSANVSVKSEYVTPSDLEERLVRWDVLWRQGNKSLALRKILLFAREYSEFPESVYQSLLNEEFYVRFKEYRDKDIVTIEGEL